MKRIFDITTILFTIPFWGPIFLFTSLFVRIKLGSPIFFRQRRPGLRGQLFEMVKFRTMTNAKDKQGTMLSDEDRLTAFGKALRATSLDELPELWNVLKGEMSLVGPRPLLEKYLPLYSPRQAKRHDIKPGITGWAQINGRNAISWEEKFELDVWYVENQSFWLDMKILFLTIKKILSRHGINTPTGTPMPIFDGVTLGERHE